MKNRKIKLIKLLKISILFLGFSTLLMNCEKDELINSETKKIQVVDFYHISEKIQNSIPEIKSKSNLNNKKSESQQNLSYNFQEVVKLVDSIGNFKFTIEFKIKEQPANVFYNLVIGEDNQGKILNPLVFKYTINNYLEYLEELKLGHLKLEGEKETLDYYSFKENYANSKKSINYGAKLCGGNTEPILWYSNNQTESFWWEEWETRKTYIVWEEEGSFEFPKSRKTGDCGGSATNGSYATIINSDKCPTGFVKDIDTDECIEDEQIINNLTNKCAKGVFTELENGIFEDHPLKPEVQVPVSNPLTLNFSESILKLFNDSDNTHLTIQNGNAGNSNAFTNGATITIGDTYLANATQLSIARTIIHESVHAYINALYSNVVTFNSFSFQQKMEKYAADNGYTIGTNEFHHNFMGQYIDAMAYSLYEWDKDYGTGGNLGWEYYQSMVYSGMFQVDPSGNIATEIDTFKELVPNSNDRQAIADIILNEQNGNIDAKGTKCN